MNSRLACVNREIHQLKKDFFEKTSANEICKTNLAKLLQCLDQLAKINTKEKLEAVDNEIGRVKETIGLYEAENQAMSEKINEFKRRL